MTNAASAQAVEIGKEKLREFLESSDTGHQALAMKGRGDDDDAISLNTLDSRGKKKASVEDEDDDDDI
tara:strand:- start:616 stop:819 length:204 start_codon:yes stop_codon:yes gene_type:complete